MRTPRGSRKFISKALFGSWMCPRIYEHHHNNNIAHVTMYAQVKNGDISNLSQYIHKLRPFL